MRLRKVPSKARRWNTETRKGACWTLGSQQVCCMNAKITNIIVHYELYLVHDRMDFEESNYQHRQRILAEMNLIRQRDSESKKQAEFARASAMKQVWKWLQSIFAATKTISWKCYSKRLVDFFLVPCSTVSQYSWTWSLNGCHLPMHSAYVLRLSRSLDLIWIDTSVSHPHACTSHFLIYFRLITPCLPLLPLLSIILISLFVACQNSPSLLLNAFKLASHILSLSFCSRFPCQLKVTYRFQHCMAFFMYA